MSMTERERFEAWMHDVAKIIVGSRDPYPAGLERDYWRVWQAALASRAADVPEPLCMCKDRPASQCPGEWEPGCDLGNNEKYVRVGRSAKADVPERVSEPTAETLRAMVQAYIETDVYQHGMRTVYAIAIAAHEASRANSGEPAK